MLSKSLCPLSSQELSELTRILNTKYASHKKDYVFEIVKVESSKEKAYVCVLLHNSSESFHYPVEAQMLVQDQGMNEKEACLILLDYIDFYWEEYFRDEILLPIDWSKHTFETLEIFIRGQILNLKKEKEADEWLSRQPKKPE